MEPDDFPESPRSEYSYKYRNSFPLNITRWLHSKAGQPWSKVYSEYCQKLRRPDDRLSIQNRLDWLVETNAYKKDGKFYDSKDNEITRNFVVVDDILYNLENKYPRYRRPSDEERRAQRGVYWVQGKVVANINDIWYELVLKEYPGEPLHIYDDFLKTSYTSESDRKLYYGDSHNYCISKRQLNKNEIKKLGLKEIENE